MTPVQRRQMKVVADLIKRQLEAAELAHSACLSRLADARALRESKRTEKAGLAFAPDLGTGAGPFLERRRSGLTYEAAALGAVIERLVKEREARRKEISRLLRQKCMVDALSADVA